MSEMKSLKKQLEDLKKEYLKAGKKAFVEESKKLFKDNPKMTDYSWTQYTDYFNDGDPVHFHAHTDSPSINGYCWEYGEKDDSLTEEECKAAIETVKEFLYQFDNDVLEHLFGDHVKVTVTKKGATVEHYHHD